MRATKIQNNVPFDKRLLLCSTVEPGSKTLIGPRITFLHTGSREQWEIVWNLITEKTTTGRTQIHRTLSSSL